MEQYRINIYKIWWSDEPDNQQRRIYLREWVSIGGIVETGSLGRYMNT